MAENYRILKNDLKHFIQRLKIFFFEGRQPIKLQKCGEWMEKWMCVTFGARLARGPLANGRVRKAFRQLSLSEEEKKNDEMREH